MVPDPLSTDEGEDRSGAKKDFIGEVMFSRPTCDCEICEKGRQNANFEREGTTYDHPFAIEPLTEYDGQQNVLGLTVNNNFQSKWMVLIGHLQTIHGNLADEGVESLDELGEFLTGRVYEFKDITWTEDEEFEYPGVDKTVNLGTMFAGSENLPNSMLVPTREVTDADELANLGVEESGEVEEVDL